MKLKQIYKKNQKVNEFGKEFEMNSKQFFSQSNFRTVYYKFLKNIRNYAATNNMPVILSKQKKSLKFSNIYIVFVMNFHL